ncbi:MAG: hypothetical protein ACYTE3_28850 [Planctomycetota bacterium]|jgi:hypothetical protein
MRFPIDFGRNTGRLCSRFGPGGQRFTKKLQFPQFESERSGSEARRAEPISSQPEQFQQIISEPSANAEPINPEPEQFEQIVHQPIDSESLQFE